MKSSKRLYADFIDVHKGESIVVCGCGRSVSLLTTPERYTTIGVNDLGRLFTPNYLVIVDPIRYKENGRGHHMNQAKANTIFTQYKNLDVANKQNIVLIKLGKRGTLTLDNKAIVDYSNNSPYMACIIAYHMGAKRIGLLGVDFTEDHFFGKTGKYILAPQIEMVKQHYKLLWQEFQKRGVEFYNLSKNSKIDTIPHLSLEDFK